MTEKASVLIVDDHQLIRSSLRSALTDAGFDVVGEAADGVSAVLLAASLRPRVIVMDISMKDGDGITATREIMRVDRRNRVVMLSMHGEPDMVRRAIRAGAIGFVTKDSQASDIVQAVRLAASGDIMLTQQLAEAMLHQSGHDQPLDVNGDPVLSQREIEVLQLIARGLSTPEIADQLYISQKTLKNHLASIYNKLDARDRTHAVILGVKLGIVDLN